jgi:hypothetical protein
MIVSGEALNVAHFRESRQNIQQDKEQRPA